MILIVLANFLNAQVFNPYVEKTDTLAYTDSRNPEAYKKPAFSVQMGTVFGFSKVYGNSFGTFISPRLSYPMSKRFTLSSGMTFYRNTGNYINSPFDGTTSPAAFSGSLLFVEGAYKLNENLTLTGAAFHDINLQKNNPSFKQNPAFENESYKGVIMGAHYKLGENVFIEGSVEFSNGRNPYLQSPFMRSPFSPSYNPYLD